MSSRPWGRRLRPTRDAPPMSGVVATGRLPSELCRDFRCITRTNRNPAGFLWIGRGSVCDLHLARSGTTPPGQTGGETDCSARGGVVIAHDSWELVNFTQPTHANLHGGRLPNSIIYPATARGRRVTLAPDPWLATESRGADVPDKCGAHPRCNDPHESLFIEPSSPAAATLMPPLRAPVPPDAFIL
jgi:hypothetical protein